MEIGIILLPTPGGQGLIRRAHRAAAVGIQRIGVGDVPGPDGELYTALGQLAASGVTAAIGPMVTNPVSRHPAVSAAAINAVAQACGHGAFMGLGRGGSPLADLGIPRPSTAELASGAAAVKAGLARLGSPVPVWISAYGPSTLRVAAEVADGVIVAGGATVSHVRAAIASVRSAVRRAGRDLSAVEVSVMVRVSVGADRAEAVQRIRANLASAGANNLRAAVDLAALSEDTRARLAELRRRYDATPVAHVSPDSPNADLIDELGLTEMLADRYAVAGTAAQVAQRFAEYRGLGVDAVWVPAVESEPEELIERVASVVAG